MNQQDGGRAVSRRDFLRGVTAGTAIVGASGVATAQENGGTKTVDLVDYAFNPGTDNPLEIKPGTTVKFVWKTGGHNIVVTKQPDGADWQGHEPIEDQGFTYTHTFTVKGEYDFHCQPHKSLGMVATMKVTDNPSTPAAGQATIDPEEMGVPFQAHYVGIAAITGLIVSLVFTFYTLKYGESPNASSPNRKR